ncbi:MAG TPA: DUF2071 domain-containing protein, partial [Pseudonocardiaceae bacterium]|nr:DUF2071 domain-containing protein [Pseudonocardiaceae bacterium]
GSVRILGTPPLPYLSGFPETNVRLYAVDPDSGRRGVVFRSLEAARLLPVLAARERAVNELFAAMFPEAASRSFSVGNAAGWHAGRAAADLAVLDTRRAVDAGNR